VDDASDGWRLWVTFGFALLFVFGTAAWLAIDRWRPWDPRLGAERTAEALRAREGGSIRYSCKRQEEDSTLDGMSDVDYLCEPIGHPQHTGYWVGTNSHRITALQQTG